jgi:phosphatidylserine/phosphatidylglycerophosphate/cardiolipin synthase-like enzyme
LIVVSVVCSTVVAGGGVVPSNDNIASSLATPNTTAPTGEIVELYPNPTTDQNHGEYVTVDLSVTSNWTLTDGRSIARLPANETGRFAVTRHPNKTAIHTNATLVEPTGYLRFSVDGETLKLKQNGTVVDTVTYEQAPESQQWRVDREPHWQPAGFVQREPTTVESEPVEAFVLPDNRAEPIEAIEGADRRLYLAAYTLTSDRVVDELTAAKKRGATVTVLVEGGPVGGMTTRQADTLDKLSDAGIEVQVMSGDRARFRYHHAKYAVVDDRAVVLSENWKPSGTGGRTNRGWGVTVDDAETADELAAIFEHDTEWNDTVSWSEFRTYVETQPTQSDESTDKTYPQNHPPVTATAEEVTILAAPDNADEELVDLINETDSRLLIVQPRIGDIGFPLLRATVRAAERGVEVQILLGNSWYDTEENQALATSLRDQAERSDLPLEVRLADADRRFGKIHAKGVVADDTVAVGSLNWNKNAVENNREVVLVVEDETVADYYADVFEGDWSTEYTDEIPAGVLIVGIGVAGGAVLVLKRRLTFVDGK